MLGSTRECLRRLSGLGGLTMLLCQSALAASPAFSGSQQNLAATTGETELAAETGPGFSEAGVQLRPVPESSTRVQAGPLFHQFPLTLEAGEGTEALGPLYYKRDGEEDLIWAIPPFISVMRSHDGDQRQVFILPPVFTWRRYGEDVRWQIGQLLNASRQVGIQDPDVRRFNLFPLFFYQDASDPARDYWAFFPFYGTLLNRVFRDEAEFVLFPLWLKSRKGTMTTRNVVFPIFHLRDGPGLHGWQFWPVAGHEHLEPSTRTNVADEMEVIPGHDKTFALWPVYFRNRLGLGTDNPSRINAVLPLWYRDRSPSRDHTSVMWPLFSWTDDRQEKFRQWNFPWPIVGFARGEGRTLNRVIPFFSVGHNKTLESETYAWPLYRRHHLNTETVERERRQWAVFLYVDLKERNKETGKSARRIDSWPLFSWTRDPDGKERLQALSLIEPLRRGYGVARNWSPLWSVWRAERDPATGRDSQSLLWNLYRRDAGPAATKGSLLFGLVQYHKDSEGRRWRLFHLGPRLNEPARTMAPASHVSEYR